MKVQCPKCEAAYKISDSKIPDKGGYARCFKCQARFFLMKPRTEGEPGECRQNTQKNHSRTDKKRERTTDRLTSRSCNGHEHSEKTDASVEGKHPPSPASGSVPRGQSGKTDASPEGKSLPAPASGFKAERDSAIPPELPQKRKAKPRKDTAARSFFRSSPGRLNFLLDVFSRDLAIDLGTANTLIYTKGKGIVLNEPSVVALRTNSRMEKQVLSVGTDAKKMLGKVPANIIAIRPMRDGVIANFEIAEAMLRHFIKKVRNGMSFFRPRIVIAVPFGITPVEKRAVKDAAERAGVRKVFLIEEPMAAAIGSGLDITKPRCNMVVDIGGGTTEVAVISLTGIVSSRSLRVAGDRMDDSIIRYIKKKYNFIIGERTAEKIKITIGNAHPDNQNPEVMEIKGWDIVSGKPRVLSIDSKEVREAILEQMYAIVNAVKFVLDHTPHELTADVVRSGITLTGGVALLKNLDKFLSEETGLPIIVAENPLLTVALGSGKTLDNTGVLEQIRV